MASDLLKAISARAEALIEHLPGALDGDANDTHRSRVAARRLAEVLRLVGTDTERLMKQVRNIRRALGMTREMDVVSEDLTTEAERHAWAPALVTRVRRHLDDVATRRRVQSLDELRRFDPSKLRRGIRAAGAAASNVTSMDVAERLRERRATREASLERAARAAGAMYDIERLHRVRIHIKKLRYTLEVAADVRGMRTAKRVAELKELQEALGRLHDLQMLQTQIRGVEGGLVPGRGRVAHGLARMADDLEADCRALHAVVLPRIRRLGR